MRLIDIDALPDDCAWCCDALIEAINDAPAIDAVEVVRCRDCKYWRDDHTCREHSLVSPMGANEFCSRGERGDSDDD